MSTYTWSIPAGKEITGSTYLKDTDNYLGDTINDLVDFVNGEGRHENQGMTYDFVDKDSDQTVTGVKRYTQDIIGNLTGNVTGNVSGNSSTASTLISERTISISGDAVGSIVFDGSSDVDINVEIADDSHKHDARYYTETEVDTLLNNSLSPLVGMVIATARASAPNGFLECNGATISRITYSSLFSAIGITYGVGDGSTTFQLPDLRGEFIRGWDNTRGIDSGRTIGSWQVDELKSHSHTGITNTTGAHTHTYSGMYNSRGPINGDTGLVYQNTQTTSSSGAHSHTVTIDSTGGTETRPRNIAMMYCIKY